jgi:hypothetical protein
MRAFATVLLSIVTALGLWLFWALNGALTYATDPAAVAATAERSDVHGAVLQAAELFFADELGAAALPAKAREVLRIQARPVLRDAIPPGWFYDGFATAYGDVLAVIAERPTGLEDRPAGSVDPVVTEIDLRDNKARLKTGLLDIGDNVDCPRLFGDGACRDERSRRRARLAYHAAVAGVMTRLPDAIHVEKIVRKAGKTWLHPDSPKLRMVRRAMGLAQIARYAGLASLLVLLALLALLNRPFLRVLATLGSVLAVSAALYFVGVRAADELPAYIIERTHARERLGLESRDSAVGPVAAQSAERLARSAAHDAMHASDSLVIATFVLGAGALVFSLVAGNRRFTRGRQ